MASIATAAPLSDLQISRQIENRLSTDDALENVTVSVQTSVASLSGTACTAARPVLGTQDGSDVIHSRFSVRLPDLDQTSEIVRLKHQQAQQVGTCRLPRAQASGQVTEEPRQPGFEVAREFAEVLRGPDDNVVDGTEPVPLIRRQFPQKDVQVLEAERVPVVVVEKHRVEELSGDLEGRGITVDQ